MTFYNIFQNLNMNYLNNGVNNCFTPQFGLFEQFSPPAFNWNMPSLFNFSSPLFNWGMPSLFNFNYMPQPTIDLSKMFSWENMFNQNVNFNQNNFSWNTNFSNLSSTDTFTRATTPISKPTIRYNTSSLKLDNYNESFGKKLAETALEYTSYKCDRSSKTVIKSKKKSSYDWDGLCATYVKMAIRDSGGGSYVNGHAYQMTDILSKNKKFKRISTNVDLKSLPAGCILVYGKGVENYSNEYGHVEITLGDGRAASDAITKNLHKKPSAIFMPTYA